MRTRPVFESYSAFVNHLYTAVNEEEGGSSGSNVDFLLDSLKGVFKKQSSALFTTAIQKVNDFMNSAVAAKCKTYSDDLKNFFSKLGAKSYQAYNDGGAGSTVGDYYYYFKDGYVSVINAPEMESDGTVKGIETVNETVNMPLSDLLRGLFEYNLALLHRALPPEAGDINKPNVLKRSLDDYSIYTRRVKVNNVKDVNRPLVIEKNSMKSSTIEIIRWGKGDHVIPGKNVEGAIKGNEAILVFPIIYVGEIKKGEGKLAGTEAYTTVVEPTAKSIPASNLSFSSADYGDGDEAMDKEGFFADNDTVITKGGMAEIRAFISKWNKIDTIEVSGSASNLGTTRSGGNEKLAKDRRSAGMKALESIKGEGAKQLEGSEIKEGTATVQPAGEKADPKKRNVTFTVSGQLKSTEGDLATAGTDGKGTAEEPKTITKMVDKKFDRLRLYEVNMYIAINKAK